MNVTKFNLVSLISNWGLENKVMPATMWSNYVQEFSKHIIFDGV